MKDKFLEKLKYEYNYSDLTINGYDYEITKFLDYLNDNHLDYKKINIDYLTANISGTSDLAPLEEQENMLVELFPEAKKVGILYCSAEANSVYQAQVFEKYLEEDGIEYEEYTAADSNEIQSVVTSAVETCDVLYLPTDNTMAANTEILNNVAQPAGVPIIAGEEGICAGCGVATLSISYYDIGYKAGEMAYDILVNGTDITTMDVEYAPQVTKEYNQTICDALGIAVPDDYVAIEN